MSPPPGGQVRDPHAVAVRGGQLQRDVRVRPGLPDRLRPDEHRVHALHAVAGHAAGVRASDELRRQVIDECVKKRMKGRAITLI